MSHRLIVAACCVVLAACQPSEQDSVDGLDALVLDTSRFNFEAAGGFEGMELDLSLADAGDLESGAEREYRGPHLAGTDPADEVPDMDQTHLCEMGVELITVIDGTEWEVDFEFENFDPHSFGAGTYAIVGPDEMKGAGRTALEFQMTSSSAEFESTAISGEVAIDVFSAAGEHPESDLVDEGGQLGVRFILEFGPGEVLKGSFFVGFGESDVEGSEC